MTKTLSELAKLKLEVINYHNHDISNPDNKVGGRVVNEQFIISLARDACFASARAVKFKSDYYNDLVAQYDIAVDNNNISEARRCEYILERIPPEVDELKYRHNADLEVYKELTGGETWLPKGSSNENFKAKKFKKIAA